MKIVTMSTLGTGRLLANLLTSCQILGIDSDVHVYCEKPFTPRASALSKLGIRSTFHVTPELAAPPKGANWGSFEFLQVVQAKLKLLVELSHPSRFEPFLFLDADTVFLNRLPTSFPDFLTFQSDARDFTRESKQTAEYCMGCFWSPTPARAVWLLALDWLKGKCYSWSPAPSAAYFDDQTAVNQILPSIHRMTATLDPALWLNGSRAFDCPQNHDVAPILVHANWRVGAKRKEAELRTRDWWFVSDADLARCGL
jgi:hypothetical protein